MRWLSCELSTSGGGAPSTASESYSLARGMRSVRVSETPMPGPVTLLRSRATARTCTMSPGLSFSDSRFNEPASFVARALPASVRWMTPDLNVKFSPSPELTMYSNHPASSP